MVTFSLKIFDFSRLLSLAQVTLILIYDGDFDDILSFNMAQG